MERAPRETAPSPESAMLHPSRRIAPFLLAAGLAAAGPAFAGDCWAPTRAERVTGAGDPIAKPLYARLKGATEAAEKLLRADPRLNAIAGVRHQANRFITLPVVEGGAFTASTWAGLHGPKAWRPGCTLDQGLADYMAPASVTLSFNTPADIAHALPSQPNADGPAVFPLTPQDAEVFERTGVIAYNRAAVRLYRAGGKRSVTPFTVREHLAFWEKELARISADGGAEFADPELARLRARRAELSPAQLNAQAALSATASGESLWGFVFVGGPDAAPLYQIAPDLLAPTADKGAVQVVVAEYSIADAEAVPEADLRAWLDALDLSPLDPFFAK